MALKNCFKKLFSPIITMYLQSVHVSYLLELVRIHQEEGVYILRHVFITVVLRSLQIQFFI